MFNNIAEWYRPNEIFPANAGEQRDELAKSVPTEGDARNEVASPYTGVLQRWEISLPR
jgi:hypothetical protein